MSSLEDYFAMEARGDFDKSDVRCAECKYWIAIGEAGSRADYADSGMCHRYPPVFDPSWLQEKIITRSDEFDSDKDSSYWVLPVVDRHSFCGEHTPKDVFHE